MSKWINRHRKGGASCRARGAVCGPGEKGGGRWRVGCGRPAGRDCGRGSVRSAELRWPRRGGPEAGWRGSTPLNSTNARLLVRGEYVASPSAHFANTRFEFTRNFLVVTRTDVGNVETRFGRVHVSSKKAASTARRPLRYAASPLRLLRGRLAQRDLHVSLPAARRAARGACPQRARCPACL